MASIRKLPSGKWQCLVTGPDGKQHSVGTFRLKTAAKEAGRDYEANRERQSRRDPRAGRITLDAWHVTWQAGRTVEKTSAEQDRYTWRLHVQPRWGKWPLEAIQPEHVRAWIADMIKDGKSPYVIARSKNLLSAMLRDACTSDRLSRNPCAGVRTPRIPKKRLFFWTQEQAEQICQHLGALDALTVETVMRTGLRWGEFAGLPVRNIDLDRGLLYVTQVQTARHGVRLIPKSEASNRSVSIPPWLIEPLRALIDGRDPDALVFVPDDATWLDPVKLQKRLDDAIAHAGVPRGTLHAMRHTAASWWVQAGVPLYEVQAALGHEDSKTTQRYAHLAPDAHSAIRGVWAREQEHAHNGTCHACGQPLPDTSTTQPA